MSRRCEDRQELSSLDSNNMRLNAATQATQLHLLIFSI